MYHLTAIVKMKTSHEIHTLIEAFVLMDIIYNFLQRPRPVSSFTNNKPTYSSSPSAYQGDSPAEHFSPDHQYENNVP
jgi:hypothetical protein